MAGLAAARVSIMHIMCFVFITMRLRMHTHGIVIEICLSVRCVLCDKMKELLPTFLYRMKD